MSHLSNNNGNFDEVHLAASNGEPPVMKAGCIFFADGAWRENSNPGSLFEPPRDRAELLQNRILYFQICYDKALATFDEAKEEMLVSAKSKHFTPSERDTALAKQHLTKLRDNLRVAKRKLDLIMAPVREAEEARIRQDAELEADLAAQRDTFANAIKTIEV